MSNVGEESVFLTTNTGQTWCNVMGNLKAASGVCGKVQPGGVHLVDLDNDCGCCCNSRALLMGTSNRIMVTFVTSNHHSNSSTEQHWTRLGTLDEFPIVLTADVNY